MGYRVLPSQVKISGSGVKKAITYIFCSVKERDREKEWNLLLFKGSEYE
jgi:hypothetical protein